MVDEIVSHKWENDKENDALMFQVKWNMVDTTREPHKACNDLQALDNYLDLLGMKHVGDLPQKSGSPVL